MVDQRISEQQLQALDDADEYSLRHHSSEVGLLIESYRAALLEAATLRSSQFVPGVLHCAKCKFQLTKKHLCMGSGTVRAGDNKTEPCPNGCGPLWPVTWKQADDENQEIIGRLCDEKRELLAQIEQLQADKARLDWFDRLNASLNRKYGTTYLWKVVANHNVNRLMLDHMVVDMSDQDCNGLPSCRAAIDAAMANGGKADA